MNTSLNIERLPIDRLKPAAYNPRKNLKPGDKEYEKIKRSIQKFGYDDPIVWNEVTGNIVGGHQRYKILVAEGATEIDCVVVHIDNDDDEKALNIALNKATGDWDLPKLADLIKDLQLVEYDVPSTGFDVEEVDVLFSQVYCKNVRDDAYEIDATTVHDLAMTGDVWHLGRHVLMCTDPHDDIAVDALMRGVNANAVVTSVPSPIHLHEVADGEWLCGVFRNMSKHTVHGGSIYAFYHDDGGATVRQAFKSAGYKLSCVCAWVKDIRESDSICYGTQHEPVLYGWLPGYRHRWFSDRKQTTVWEYPIKAKDFPHPEKKPVQLIAYAIRNSAAQNAVVLDLFGAFGTTVIACEETDRICRTMEINPAKASVIVERYHKAYPDKKISVLRGGRTYTLDELTKAK